MADGGVHGFPVVDVRVDRASTASTTRSTPSEMSFKMAGRLAFREAMAQAEPVVLEPISRLEVTVPADLQGDVMGDLNARRGRVQGTEAADRASRRSWRSSRPPSCGATPSTCGR